MVNDDSLTDDESFFDIYSAKNTTSVYNSILEKIKAEHSTSQKEKPSTGKENEIQLIDTKETSTGSSTSQQEAAGGSNITEVPRDDASVASPRVGNPLVQRSTRTGRRQRNRRANIEVLERVSVGTRRRARQRRTARTTPEIIELTNDELEILPGDLYVEEGLNYEVSVKVLWKSVNVKTFRLRRFQKLTQVFEYFMKEENVPFEKILLQVGDTKVTINDTPETLKLKVCDFIEGGILSDEMVPLREIPTIQKSPNSNQSKDQDHLTVKIQGESKALHKFSMHKRDYFQIVMVKYAEEIETPLNKMKFYYDGDVLQPSDTPSFVGMEDDEIIDAVLMK